MPVSGTHELLMHQSCWLAVRVWGGEAVVTDVGAGVKSVKSCVYRIDCCDLTLSPESSVTENKTLH